MQTRLKSGIRLGRIALTVLAIGWAPLAGCTATTSGHALKAPAEPNEPIVALLDTGSYPTAAGPPVGAAGSDALSAASAEAQRMADYVIGPWQVDASLTVQDAMTTTVLAAPPNVAVALVYPLSTSGSSNPWVDIAQSRGFVAGFTTGRVGADNVSRLQNVVLRFPDAAAAAAAAATEMMAVPAPDRLAEISWSNKQSINTDALNTPWQPHACPDNASYLRNAGMTMSAQVGDRKLVRSFTAYGPYVLYQFAANTVASEACHAVLSTAVKQQQSNDQFVPTPIAEMGDLPEDPSGELWARTVWRSDDESPLSAGIWQRNAWLHFVGSPNETSALLADAGVDWVSQRLIRVYRARDAQSAARFMDKAVTDVASLRTVRPTAEGVPGFPGARCFVRTDWVPNPRTTFEQTSVQMLGRVKCFAATGRYMFTSISDQEKDAKQQISAQYRVVAGQ